MELKEQNSKLEGESIERKRAEQGLRRERDFIRTLLKASPSFFVAINAKGKTLMMNQAMLNAVGYTADEVIGKDYLSTFVPLTDRKMLSEIFENLTKVHQPTLNENHILTKDGRKLLVEWHGVPILKENGALDFFFGVGLDITERVRLEETMIQTEKMMSLGGLAAGMAHEVNNPLSGILQSAQNILIRTSPELQKNLTTARECGTDLESIRSYLEKRDIFRFMESIREAGIRAAEIINNMLQFSRRSESNKVPVNLPVLIDKTIELASSDYDLKKCYDFRKIRIHREYDPDLPDVLCVETEIGQVLLNLLKNAGQAMADREDRTEPPMITLRSWCDGEMACIEVEDNGPGMDEEVRTHLFEPFFTTKEKGMGTGLGLSVSYFIITSNHQGRMWVESTKGKGSRFIIHLPIQQLMS